jgi:hypothetical protein
MLASSLVAMNRHGIIRLLGNGSVSTFPWKRVKQNNTKCLRWWSIFGSPWSYKSRNSFVRDSDPLKRTSSIYKRQTRPFLREGAPEEQDRNCQTVTNIWSWTPGGGSTPRLTDWPSVAVWLWLWLREFNYSMSSDFRSSFVTAEKKPLLAQ